MRGIVDASKREYYSEYFVHRFNVCIATSNASLLSQVTFTLSEAAAERGMIDGAGQLYRKSRRGGTATLQQLPGVIFMPEGSASAAGIFNSSPVNENKHDSDEVKIRIVAMVNGVHTVRLRKRFPL